MKEEGNDRLFLYYELIGWNEKKAKILAMEIYNEEHFE